MLSILAPLVSWIFRAVVVKFIILTAVFAVMSIVIPAAIAYVSPAISTSSLSSSFSGIDSGVWWLLDFFSLGFGVPLLISAGVTRFLIRRLPVIG